MDLQEGLLTFGTKWLMAGCSEVHTTCSERCFHIPPRQRGSHGCGGGNADCDFQPRRRQKRTEIGLSERQFELKSFTIIIARNRTGSRRKIADWERTERARRDSANCFEMWWPGTELNRRRQPFQVALISIHNNLTGLRWLRKCFKSRG